MKTKLDTSLGLASQSDTIQKLVATLDTIKDQKLAETYLQEYFRNAPDDLVPDFDTFYSQFNYYLYLHILKNYKHNISDLCLWRFFKCVSKDQLNYPNNATTELVLLDCLVRIYYYSAPLGDLTCIFIPIYDNSLIRKYLEWIQRYFYNVDYPTSLLWLYALDSSLASLFPDEIIYLGQKSHTELGKIVIPNFDYPDGILIKRYSEKPGHYAVLKKQNANNEFQQFFGFLQQEYQDRCLSHSGRQDEYENLEAYRKEWEKFEDVLKFGVSDKHEFGCVSFSDMRASTEFLNTYGKRDFLNKIQQPFFEKTKVISKKHKGRIDKFMGDNVMCVFLNNNMPVATSEIAEGYTIIHHFMALIDLNKVLYELIVEKGFLSSRLGLRSGVTYGSNILRSNLGNEIVRDFTVTGETVNLAARMEHISVSELIIHNNKYFEKAIERFPEISKLMTLDNNYRNLNPETQSVIREFTLNQNIFSNLQKLMDIRFDIRFNHMFYLKLKQQFIENNFPLINPDTSEMYGYEEFNVSGFHFKFYFSFYNPKGFNQFEKIWILPLDFEMLKVVDSHMFEFK